MFNGLTMWLLDFYNVNLNTEVGNNSGKGSPENYHSELNDYTQKIKSITDALTNLDEIDDNRAGMEWEQLIKQMESSFNRNIEEYFKKNPDELKAFRTEIGNCIIRLQNKNEWSLPQAYEPLQEFCNKIDGFLNGLEKWADDNWVVNVNEGKDKKAQNEVQTDQNKEQNLDNTPNWINIETPSWNDIKPSSWNDINTLTWINKNDGKLYEKGLDKDLVKNTISTINSFIDSLQKIENPNQKIKAYMETLTNIKTVIEHPNSKNTQALQIFILANLKDNTDFLMGNFKGWNEKNPDGLFGKVTLDWVNTFLNNLGADIKNIIATNPEAIKSGVIDGNNETLERPKAPKCPIQGKLENIVKWTEGQRETKLWSKLERNKPQNETNVPNELKLYEATGRLGEQLKKIEGYKSIEWVAEAMTNLENNLNSIQDVINNTTEDNVRILQKFIAENLDDKSVFDAASKKSGNYDGKFWTGTLAWLNAVLDKVDKYFTAVDEYSEKMKNYNSEKQIDKITWKSGVKIWETDPEKLVDNKPNGAKVEFKDGEQKKLNNTGNQEITLVVTLSDGTKQEITVKVTVVESTDKPDNNSFSSNQLESHPSSTDPLTIKEGDNNRTYKVVENSPTIAKNAELSWATFYLATNNESNQPSEGGNREYQRVPEWVNDYQCIMKLWNNFYKVDICNWYLCPVATKLIKKSDETYEEDEWGVLFMNNPSCIKYLEQKMPKVGNKYTIWWSERKNDYNLQSYDKRLTIEPMTIAWDWISRKGKDNPDYLSKNLAFLNLTNYIRSEWDKHNRPDPDVNRKVDKFKRIRDGKDKLPIDRSKFWLTNATEQELARFKRYNNWEQWEDDWDKKRKNRPYQKIKLG